MHFSILDIINLRTSLKLELFELYFNIRGIRGALAIKLLWCDRSQKHFLTMYVHIINFFSKFVLTGFLDCSFYG